MAEANGIYTELRYARIALNNDRHHLECAPLSVTARKRLIARIKNEEARLKELNAKHRAYLAQRKKL